MHGKNFREFVVGILILLCFSTADYPQTYKIHTDRDSIAVRKTAEDFLNAFRNLEWMKFIAFFADDATAFFPPSAHYPKRATGKAEIEKIFKNVFVNARGQKTTPPYLAIDPLDLQIQMLKDASIVSFHLDDPGMFGRRTVVFEKRKGKWLIVHLHASGIAAP